MPNPNEPLREWPKNDSTLESSIGSISTGYDNETGKPTYFGEDKKAFKHILRLIADDKRAYKVQADLKGQWKVWNLLRNGSEGFVNEAGNVELTPEHMDLMLSGFGKLLKEEVKEL